MVSLGAKEFVRHIYSYLFIALQLAAVFVIVILIVSGVRSRLVLYEPVKDLLDHDGFYTAFTGRLTSEDLKELVPEISSIFGASQPSVVSKDGAGFLSYNNDLIGRYRPMLAEGKWLDSAERSELSAVVNYDSSSKLGDKITISYLVYDPDDLTYSDPQEMNTEVTVIGRLQKDAHIYGLNTNTTENDDFRALYSTYNKNEPLLLMSEEQLDDKGISCTPLGHQLVVLEDGVSGERLKEIEKTIRNYYFIVPLARFGSSSKKYVYDQLIRLAPILISITILILVSTVSISALRAKMNLHTSAVYCMLGSTMHGCGICYLISSLITSLLAILMCAAFMNIMGLTGRLEQTVIAIDPHTVIWCIAVWLLFIACSMIAPMVVLSRASIKEHLSAGG